MNPTLVTSPTRLLDPSGPTALETSSVTAPGIAVVIAARDAAEFIGETLRSVAAQERAPDQVVVFDDGSTDGTRAIAESYRSVLPMLTVTGSEESIGISAARNRANALVTVPYIAVLDADDLLAPGAMRDYAEFLASSPEVDLVYGDSFVFGANPAQGVSMSYPALEATREAMRRTLASPILPLKHSSILIRRSTLEELGGYDESFSIKVDVELFLRFCSRAKSVRKLDRTISLHRKHGGQVSTKRIEGLRAYRRLARLYEPNPIVRSVLFSARSISEWMKCLVRG